MLTLLLPLSPSLPLPLSRLLLRSLFLPLLRSLPPTRLLLLMRTLIAAPDAVSVPDAEFREAPAFWDTAGYPAVSQRRTISVVTRGWQEDLRPR